jgi:hypothetical protein
MLRCPQPPKWA